MKWHLLRVIENRYAEFVERRTTETHSSAFMCLADIYNALIHQKAPKQAKCVWEEKLVQEVSTLSKTHIHSELIRDLAKLRKVVSVPGVFNDDEILLVLSIRVDLEMAAGLYEYLEWESSEICDSDVDRALQEILNDSRNAVAKIRATSLMKVNAAVPYQFTAPPSVIEGDGGR